MFGWGRKNDGFEWKDYVRTTVLFRRADRQRRVEDLRVAAAARVIDTRDRGVAAGKSGLSAVSASLARAVSAVWSFVCRAALMSGAVAGRTIRFAFERLREVQWRQSFARVPVVGRITRDQAASGVALVVGIVAAGVLITGQGGQLGNLMPDVAALVVAKPDVSGPATAVTGELLRVGGRLVHLKDIEAPGLGQPCFKSGNKRWPCAVSASSALARIVRGRPVECYFGGGEDDQGRPFASCRMGDTDVAEALVRSGHVFAVDSLMATYSSAESIARDAKAGVWQGDTERPSAWRERLWADAKKAAPDGCPIKGVVKASGRTYTLPWSTDYTASKVRVAKGERWFCSEDDARTAGFKSPANL